MSNADDMLEEERQQLFNHVLQLLHNCIWNKEEDDDSEKGLFVHLQDISDIRSIRVFKFNMENFEAAEILKALAASVIEREQVTKGYN